ncbi:alpha/beta hydrolase [Catenulispora pinisilvae]|uniref:alpha/beta hydrolase n=1 Tax=Catenulispora pinisilvae TaxID=2705253 RepID=UPI001891B9E0|nr:alpha/beta hydrolase [Catenulispora pinisilvae]
MERIRAPFVDADGVAHYRNITVSRIQGFRPLHTDLRVPPGEGRRPLVAFLHGGAFWSGSRVDLPDPLDALESPGFYERVLARGYAVADVDYRLSGEAAFPAQLEDVESTLRRLRAGADELGLDVGRFAVWGESAGGTLAALAGLDKGSDVPIHAVVDWYAPTDFTGRVGDARRPGHPIYELLDGATPGYPDRARAASPVHQVHAAAPPFLLMHGVADSGVPYSESENLAAALRAVGVRADLVPVEGAGHVMAGASDVGGLVDRVLDFLDDVLR